MRNTNAMSLLSEYLQRVSNELVPYKHDIFVRDKLEFIFENLSCNPSAISYLEQYPQFICWSEFSKNPAGIKLLKENHSRIDLKSVWQNPNVFELFQLQSLSSVEDQDSLKYLNLNTNPKVIEYLTKNPHLINWRSLSSNPRALELLLANQDKIDWWDLSGNPNAMHLLEQNQDKICWHQLLRNPNAIHLLKQNPDKIYWNRLSKNPNAMDLLKQNLHLTTM
jgi:hypothetical protein